MSLSSDQVAEYFREGWLLVPGLVPRAAVDAVLAAAPTAGLKAGGRWTPTVFSHADPGKDAAVHRLLVEPRVVDAVEAIFGVEARLYFGMLAVVPKGGDGLLWHQDNQYSQILGHALNVFIALDTITPEMAGLWVGPRTHLGGVRPSQQAGEDTYAPGHRQSLVEPEDPVQLPAMAPGDACIFDRHTLHRSIKNTTDRHRFAYAAQYMAANAVMAASGRPDPTRMSAASLRATWAGA